MPCTEQEVGVGSWSVCGQGFWSAKQNMLDCLIVPFWCSWLLVVQRLMCSRKFKMTDRFIQFWSQSWTLQHGTYKWLSHEYIFCTSYNGQSVYGPLSGRPGWEYNQAHANFLFPHMRRSLATRLDGRASQTVSDINSTSGTASQIGCVVVNKCMMLWLGCMVSYASIF